MFFHIDESGNTGNNLFDENQPTLSYGVLSSKTNVDVLGTNSHRKALEKLGVDTIHANILGVDRLTGIFPILLNLQDKFRFDFDYYFIDKPTYALTLFFDSVFDAGLNEAVSWNTYWTPLRFPMIHNLSYLFDEDLLKEAWNLCICKKVEKHENRIRNLLTELTERAKSINLDKRSKEIFCDAFRYGIQNPLKLDFGTSNQKIISPNGVGFQFVVASMAERLNKAKRKNALSITVDRQTEFNSAQIKTHYNSAKIAEGMKSLKGKDRNMFLFHPLYSHLPDEVTLRKGTPTKEITISDSASSVGLQIVDVYLWIANRALSGAELSPELKFLGSSFLRRSLIDGISMDGMARRWAEFEKKLPKFEDLTLDQLKSAAAALKKHREKVHGLNL